MSLCVLPDLASLAAVAELYPIALPSTFGLLRLMMWRNARGIGMMPLPCESDLPDLPDMSDMPDLPDLPKLPDLDTGAIFPRATTAPQRSSPNHVAQYHVLQQARNLVHFLLQPPAPQVRTVPSCPTCQTCPSCPSGTQGQANLWRLHVTFLIFPRLARATTAPPAWTLMITQSLMIATARIPMNSHWQLREVPICQPCLQSVVGFWDLPNGWRSVSWP